MMTVIDATDVPVRKTITVNVSTERAFKVFTEGFDDQDLSQRDYFVAPGHDAVVDSGGSRRGS